MPTWFPTGYPQEILYTTLNIALAILLYSGFRRYLLPVPETPQGRRVARIIVLSCIFLITFGLFVYTWHGKIPVLDRVHAWLQGLDLYGRVIWVFAAGLGIYLLAMTAQRTLTRNEGDLAARHRIRSLIHWSALGVFLATVFLIWITRSESLAGFGTFLGLLGAGVALAMQETLISMAGWFLILMHRLYDVGDRIEVNGTQGDVIHISPFYTHVLEVGGWVKGDQSTGRILSIPNSMAVRHQVYNYTRGFPFIWNEITITVTFESNWIRARETLLETAQHEAEKIQDEVHTQIRAMQSNFAIYYTRLTPIVYTTIVPHGVCLTLRHLVPARQRRKMEHEVCELALKELIAAPDIQFAYPTTRFFHNPQEGKPETGGRPVAGRMSSPFAVPGSAMPSEPPAS